MAVSPDGTSVYVTDNGDDTVSQYDIDPTSGALLPKIPATVASGPFAEPFGIAVTPDGTSVYVANDRGGASPANIGDGSVSQYDVGAGGALTPKTPAAVATFRPVGIAVSPDGKSVYATNTADNNPTGGENTVSQYDVGVGGTLTPKVPATVATGINPFGIAVTPAPRTPTTKEQCKHGGWRNFPQFRNQGECVAFVERGPKP